jgi:hypothetical protein
MMGSPDKRYVCLGPASGFSDHYGACPLFSDHYRRALARLAVCGFCYETADHLAARTAWLLAFSAPTLPGLSTKPRPPPLHAPCALHARLRLSHRPVAARCPAGHFDVLMGKRVETEVFPLIHQFLLQHDAPRPRL